MARVRRSIPTSPRNSACWKNTPLSPIAYRQLIRLANDFQVKGPLYKYFSTTFNVSDAYIGAIADFDNPVWPTLILTFGPPPVFSSL